MQKLSINLATGTREMVELSPEEKQERLDNAKILNEESLKEQRVEAAKTKLAAMERDTIRKDGPAGEALCELLDALGL